MLHEKYFGVVQKLKIVSINVTNFCRSGAPYTVCKVGMYGLLYILTDSEVFSYISMSTFNTFFIKIFTFQADNFSE